LDSSTLCLLAAEEAVDGMSPTAVTLHPAGMQRGGDLDFVPEVVKARPVLRHRWVGLNDRHLPFTALESVPPSDEPAPSTSGYTRFVAEFEVLNEIGSRIHLTGDGGDTLLCAPLLYLADLWRSVRWMRTLTHAIGWARVRRASPWPVLRGAIRASSVDHATAARQLAGQILTGSGGHARLGEVEPLHVDWYPATDAAWMTLDAREAAAQVVRQAAERPVPPGLEYAGQLTVSALQTVGRTARADAQIAAAHGIRQHNPYLDGRVVDSVASIPPRHWSTPAEFKPLLRAAFPGLLPAAVATRATKGSYEADHYRGLRANLAALRRLADGRLAGLGLVDPAPLRRTLQAAASGLPIPVSHLESVITTEAWLHTVDSAPPIRWERAPATVTT
jgi:asparagine synthase (glutamine-hydrolysing)